MAVLPKSNISNHAPISLTINGLIPTTKTKIWKFPTYLSHSDGFKDFLTILWANYVDNNAHIDDTYLFWSTAKTVLRGYIISYVNFKCKQANLQLIYEQLLQTQQAHALHPSPHSQ